MRGLRASPSHLFAPAPRRKLLCAGFAALGGLSDRVASAQHIGDLREYGRNVRFIVALAAVSIWEDQDWRRLTDERIGGQGYGSPTPMFDSDFSERRATQQVYRSASQAYQARLQSRLLERIELPAFVGMDGQTSIPAPPLNHPETLRIVVDVFVSENRAQAGSQTPGNLLIAIGTFLRMVREGLSQQPIQQFPPDLWAGTLANEEVQYAVLTRIDLVVKRAVRRLLL